MGHMAEISLLLDMTAEKLTIGLSEKRILRRFSLLVTNQVAAALKAEDKEE